MATIKTPNHRPQMATVRPKSIVIPGAEAGRTGEVVRPEVPRETLLLGFVLRKLLPMDVERSFGRGKHY
jgi:electron transfer flavoprotein alpha subunit